MKSYKEMRIPGLLVPIVLLMLPLAVLSGEQQKKINIGVGTYGLVIANNSSVLDDDQLTGYTLSGQYAFTDMFALRAAYYALDHRDFTNIDANGFDVVGYVGGGLISTGFKVYGGGGYFSEYWETSANSEWFNGLQLSGGLGYNWQNAGLDFVLALRQTSDYEDVLAGTGTGIDAAVSATLIVSARF
jgi:hypothetical protein